MKNWKVELTAEGKSLLEIHIKRGIFQGDALSPLLACNRDDATQSYTYEMHMFHKSQEKKINHLM